MTPDDLKPLAALVADQLLELPDDADSIAERFADTPIVGRRYSRSDCPMARYLKPVIPKDCGVHVEVHGARAVLVQGSLVEGNPNVGVDLPPAAVKFVTRFDSGYYLDLEEGVRPLGAAA